MFGIFSGPSRAITVLAVTQILGWGALFYPPALTMAHVAKAHGWSLALAMSGFSVALALSGLISPTACGLIDRYGGNQVMSLGALAGAVGMVLLPFAGNLPVYFVAWLFLGVAMGSVLYDPAFTTLARIFGANARKSMTIVTFAGGLASTVAWPATHLLIGSVGWRGTYLVFAAILGLVVAPLHAFALPRGARHVVPAVASSAAGPAKMIEARGWPFFLIAMGFAAHAVALSGTSAHLLPILERGGVSAANAVAIGALFGPAQVLSRLGDYLSGGRTHPLLVARRSMMLMACAFALLILAGISSLIAVVFAVIYGVSNGVMTIARGSLPIAMFGIAGYGRIVGRIARPAQISQAVAPFAFAFVVEQWSDRSALVAAMVMILIALGCFLAIRRPV
jgi:MFS family permease